MPYCAGVDKAALSAQLKALHQGRGLRRSDVRSWVGADLQQAAGVEPHDTDQQARAALVTLLSRHLAKLPSDLALIFRAATAISDDAPLLGVRLANLEKSMQRSSRVLRRRLRTVEGMLAESIADEVSPAVAPDEESWHWVNHDMHLRLGTDAVFELRRTLRVLTDNPVLVTDGFVIPNATGIDAVWDVAVIEGFEQCIVHDEVPGRWDLELRLPVGLRRGQELQTGLRFTASNARTLESYFVSAPLRTVRHLSVSVDFGSPAAASEAWLIHDGMPYAMKLADLKREPVDLEASRVAHIAVDHPRAGYVYGVGWHWAEA